MTNQDNFIVWCSLAPILVINCRRWSMGRMIGNKDALQSNIFMNHSELACAGRPLCSREIVLPRQRDLLLPESLDQDAGIRLSDRAKPSPEQVRAQKGPQIHTSLLQSLLTLDKEKFKGPVLLVNFTGYVEDMGSAVPCHFFGGVVRLVNLIGRSELFHECWFCFWRTWRV